MTVPRSKIAPGATTEFAPNLQSSPISAPNLSTPVSTISPACKIRIFGSTNSFRKLAIIEPASRFTLAPTTLSPTKLKWASFDPANKNEDLSSQPGPMIQFSSSQQPPRISEPADMKDLGPIIAGALTSASASTVAVRWTATSPEKRYPSPISLKRRRTAKAEFVVSAQGVFSVSAASGEPANAAMCSARNCIRSPYLTLKTS